VEAIDDLSEAERAFRELIADPKAYAKWAAEVRVAWLASPAGILARRQWEQKAKKTRITVEDT
jgi:uncharacterized membrane protein YjjP (DUF1212 family)